MEEKTIFEKIRDREIDSDIVYENEFVVAFRDIDPQAPTHVLVIPKDKAGSMVDLKAWDDAAVGRFFRGVAQAAEKLGLEDDGYRVVLNTGPNALQSVAYVHAHIIGGRRLSWPPG